MVDNVQNLYLHDVVGVHENFNVSLFTVFLVHILGGIEPKEILGISEGIGDGLDSSLDKVVVSNEHIVSPGTNYQFECAKIHE